MAVKIYNTQQEYNADTRSTTESTVSLVKADNDVKYDGVNVRVSVPKLGDAVYHDGSKVVFIKGDTVNTAAMSGLTSVGVVIDVRGDEVLVADKTETGLKYADVVQYAFVPVLDGESHTYTIGVRTSYNWDANTEITFSYGNYVTIEDVVAILNNAIEEVFTNRAIPEVMWAYMANDDNEQVFHYADATKIIVQFDEWTDWRQYICSGMTLVVWGDMPEHSAYLKNDGGWTNCWGVMNRARTRAWATNNGRIPTTMEPVVVTGNPAPVRPSCFEDSTAEGYAYCADLRAKFGTYDNYLHYGLGVMYPQKYGCFGLPDGKTLTKKYGNKTAPSKGGTKFKFPALHKPLTINYGIEGIGLGDWFLPGVLEGMLMMDDERNTIINTTAAKMGITGIYNWTYRWFAQRYSVVGAWHFDGNYGGLGYDYVNNGFTVRGVALLKIKS